MKNYKTPLLAILALTLFSFSLNTSLFQKEYEDVGCIKQSMFKPIQFNKTQQGTWVLLDGSEINPQSKFFELLSDNHNLDILTFKDGMYYLPDARGVFIRSSNVNGQGFDPDKNRKIGSFQGDAIRNITGRVGSWSVRKGQPLSNGVFENINAGNPYQGEYHNQGAGQAAQFDASRVVPVSSENRPVSISMYTYIKISN